MSTGANKQNLFQYKLVLLGMTIELVVLMVVF